MSRYVLEKCHLECNQNMNCIFFNGCRRYKDYQQGRADAIEEIMKNYCIIDNLGCEYVVIDKATLEHLKGSINE